MEKRTLVLVLSLMLAGSISAWADRPPVNSLNDLPSKWVGVAGNLFTQDQGALSIDRILRVEREERSNGFSATYDVEARISLGTRTIPVNKIDLSSSTQARNVYWLTLQLNDALVPRVWASVTYDEATNTFSLKEMPRQGGERRFVFQARASQ